MRYPTEAEHTPDFDAERYIEANPDSGKPQLRQMALNDHGPDVIGTPDGDTVLRVLDVDTALMLGAVTDPRADGCNEVVNLWRLYEDWVRGELVPMEQTHGKWSPRKPDAAADVADAVAASIGAEYLVDAPRA